MKKNIIHANEDSVTFNTRVYLTEDKPISESISIAAGKILFIVDGLHLYIQKDAHFSDDQINVFASTLRALMETK